MITEETSRVDRGCDDTQFISSKRKFIHFDQFKKNQMILFNLIYFKQQGALVLYKTFFGTVNER